MEELEARPQDATQTIKDLASGACGGIAQVLLGEILFLLLLTGLNLSFCSCLRIEKFCIAVSGHLLVVSLWTFSQHWPLVMIKT